MMRWLAGMVALVVLAAAGAAGWLVYQWELPYRGYSGRAAVVDVPHGATTHEIAGLMQRKGVVRSGLAFEVWSRWHGSRKLEAGEYRFSGPMTPAQVFEQVAGGHVWTVSLVVPEGWTMFDIAGEVAEKGLATRQQFLRAARNPALVRDIAPSVPTLEGFLFPATYQFPHRTTAGAMTEAMVQRFREAWERAAKSDAPSKLSLEQAVSLASLVEEETPKAAERPVIAAVFLNRLKLGYPLECDPSVVYALKLAGRYDGKLVPAELRIASPYNTYLHYGLPPGPIGNPGLASIEAVLQPAQVDYLYFVADGSGGHVFSRTLAEHRRNVAKYRRFLAAEKKETQTQETPRRHPHAAHKHPARRLR